LSHPGIIPEYTDFCAQSKQPKSLTGYQASVHRLL
jgi:hypothetical protein